MSLNNDQLHELLLVAKSAALSAGKMIKKNSKEEFEINYSKEASELAGQIVTEIDLASEKIILDALNPTLESYDLGLLTEESVDDESRFHKDYFWCIDPLDGTLAFSRNEWGHSISIALVSKSGEAIIGVVYDNCGENLYWAIRGEGAYRNDEKFFVDNLSDRKTLFIDHSFDPKSLDSLNDFDIHIPGGAVMNAISTIEKAPAIYMKKPKDELGGGSIWDFAATSIIHHEAGGFNSDFSGNRIDLNNKESTFMNSVGVKFVSSKDLLDICL